VLKLGPNYSGSLKEGEIRGVVPLCSVKEVVIPAFCECATLNIPRRIIKTDIFVKLEEGEIAWITPVYGIAAGFGVTMMAAPGLVTWETRNDLRVVLANYGLRSYLVKRGEVVGYLTKMGEQRWNITL